QPIRLERAAEARRLDGREPMMDVVQQMRIESEARAQRVEKLRHMIEILRRRPRVLGRDGGIGRLVIELVLRHAIRRWQSGNAALRANRLVAETDVALDFIGSFRDVVAVRMAVHHDAAAARAAQKLVERQPGDFALDVPERGVDSGDRAHRHRTPAPVGTAIEVLPRVFNARRIAADEHRNDVLGEISRNGALAAIERGIADAVDALVGFDLQRDEVAAGAGDDDAGGGDLHGRGRWRTATGACVCDDASTASIRSWTASAARPLLDGARSASSASRNSASTARCASLANAIGSAPPPCMPSSPAVSWRPPCQYTSSLPPARIAVPRVPMMSMRSGKPG